MADAGGSFAVTPESLTALAGSVLRVRDQLDGTADLAGDCSAALGSGVVASALHHFVTGWRDGRAQIGAEVNSLAVALRQAADVYASTDGDLAAAIPAGS
jgi:hypothetical protein